MEKCVPFVKGVGGFNFIAGEFPANVTFSAGFGLHHSDFCCRCGLILEKNFQYRPQPDEGSDSFARMVN
jgi:hypothetical protein